MPARQAPFVILVSELPIKAEVREAIGREAGDEVLIRLIERLS